MLKPLNQLDASTIVANANLQGFVLNYDTPLLPQIWIMAILVAALDAWTSSIPVIDLEDDVEQHTHLILAEALQTLFIGSLNALPPGSFVTNGIRADLLRADISFWRVHAQDRGIGVAMASAIQSFPPLSILKSSPGITRDYLSEKMELAMLFRWLLGISKPPSHLSEHWRFEVSNMVTYEVAKLLRAAGMKIKTSEKLSSIEESLRDDPMRVVYFLGNTSSNGSAPETDLVSWI
jgi:hypothetical protein